MTPNHETHPGPIARAVGPWRLVRLLGRGGVGTVYLAERVTGDFTQRGALKLLRRGMDTEDVVARFLAERQILSGLDHPNIARLVDGGTTAEGRPYLVMDHVVGTPITEHCDRHRSSVEERLELFATVGDAVAYAHRRLVLHRDLKPSNILVTEEGVPKLLDFGVAKILDSSAWAVSGPATRAGRSPFTVGHASPEQLAGRPLTAASDVYQLGLLLHLLLTGRPVGMRRHVAAGAKVAAPPPRPSDAVGRPDGPTGTGSDPSAVAAARRSTPVRLRRRLRGDLDAIVLRSLREDPDDRYVSVGHLVDDVRRHLAGHPVTARPGHRWYRARRFARRHPWALPVAALALFLVVAWVATLVTHRRALRLERNVARAQALRAQETRAFFVGLFEAPEARAAGPVPSDGEGPASTEMDLRALMARGVDRIRTELGGRPDMRAALLGSISTVYMGLDEPGLARELREEALAIERDLHGPRSRRVAESLRELVEPIRLDVSGDSAVVVARAALDAARSAPDRDSVLVAAAHLRLGQSLLQLGRLDAVSHLERALALLRATEGARPEVRAEAMTWLATAYQLENGDSLRAAPGLAKEALRILEHTHGPDHVRTAETRRRVGEVLSDTVAKWHEHRRAITTLEGTLGSDHERTIVARRLYAAELFRAGEYDGAAAVLERVLAARARRDGLESPRTSEAMDRLAQALQVAGRNAEAEPYFTQRLEFLEATGGPAEVRGFVLSELAWARLRTGDPEGAVRKAREALDVLPVTEPRSVAAAECALGRALSALDRHDEAAQRLEAARTRVVSAGVAVPTWLPCLGELMVEG